MAGKRKGPPALIIRGLTVELRDRMKTIARSERRSRNAWILVTLEKAVEQASIKP
jgi:hypothetical protein